MWLLSSLFTRTPKKEKFSPGVLRKMSFKERNLTHISRMYDTHPHLRYVNQAWETEDYSILQDQAFQYNDKVKLPECRMQAFKHLRISRRDNQPIHSYMDMQAIKNHLWGKDVIAVEMYPVQGDFKDGSHTYHLWTWDGIEAQTPNLDLIYEYNLK